MQNVDWREGEKEPAPSVRRAPASADTRRPSPSREEAFSPEDVRARIPSPYPDDSSNDSEKKKKDGREVLTCCTHVMRHSPA